MCFAVISAKIRGPVISGVDKFAPFGVGRQALSSAALRLVLHIAAMRFPSTMRGRGRVPLLLTRHSGTGCQSVQNSRPWRCLSDLSWKVKAHCSAGGALVNQCLHTGHTKSGCPGQPSGMYSAPLTDTAAHFPSSICCPSTGAFRPLGIGGSDPGQHPGNIRQEFAKIRICWSVL